MLPGDVGEVVCLVVGHLAGLEDKNDPEPFRAEHPQSVVMVQTPATATDHRRALIRFGQRLESELLDRRAQVHVAGRSLTITCLPLRSVTGTVLLCPCKC